MKKFCRKTRISRAEAIRRAVGKFLLKGKTNWRTNEVLLTRPGQTDAKAKVELRGDKLLYSPSADRTVVYRRDSAGPWYDREHIDYQPPK